MTRTICSISYRHLKARRAYRLRDSDGGFNTIFEIEPAPRDGYKLLTVRDMEEDYKFSSEAPRTVMHKETTGEKVASCLISEWVGNLANGDIGGSGIFICEELDRKDATGKVIEPATKPGPNELAEAIRLFTIRCEQFCLEADDLKRIGQGKRIVRDVYNPPAVWLGKHFSWMDAPSQVFTAECPACGAEIKPGKFKCFHCGEIIDRASYNAWKREEDAIAKAQADLVGAKK